MQTYYALGRPRADDCMTCPSSLQGSKLKSSLFKDGTFVPMLSDLVRYIVTKKGEDRAGWYLSSRG